MKEILDDLKALPGVLGACLYHRRKGLLETNLPAVFKTARLTEISKLLMKIQTAGRMNFLDLTDLYLQYDGAAIVAREVEEHLFIFTFCDPGCNQHLVTMLLNLLVEELKIQPMEAAGRGKLAEVPRSKPISITEGSRSRSGSAAVAQQSWQGPVAVVQSQPRRVAVAEVPRIRPATPGTDVAPAIATEVPAIAAEAQTILETMKSCLPQILGPMAGIVFDEAVEAWQEQGHCAVADVDHLVELLVVEIGSADKVASYKKMIAPALQGAGKG